MWSPDSSGCAFEELFIAPFLQFNNVYSSYVAPRFIGMCILGSYLQLLFFNNVYSTYVAPRFIGGKEEDPPNPLPLSRWERGQGVRVEGRPG